MDTTTESTISREAVEKAAVVQRDESEIVRCHDALDGELNALHDVIAMLSDRLMPVRSTDGTDMEGADPRDASCAMGYRLNESANLAQNARMRLRSMIEELRI